MRCSSWPATAITACSSSSIPDRRTEASPRIRCRRPALRVSGCYLARRRGCRPMAIVSDRHGSRCSTPCGASPLLTARRATWRRSTERVGQSSSANFVDARSLPCSKTDSPCVVGVSGPPGKPWIIMVPLWRGHLTLAAPSVGIRLLREASTILTRISTQTQPSWRLG